MQKYRMQTIDILTSLTKDQAAIRPNLCQDITMDLVPAPVEVVTRRIVVIEKAMMEVMRRVVRLNLQNETGVVYATGFHSH
jgi:hypothetical protein